MSNPETTSHLDATRLAYEEYIIAVMNEIKNNSRITYDDAEKLENILGSYRHFLSRFADHWQSKGENVRLF